MNRLNKILATAFMGAAMLFTGAAAQAMSFPQFDSMSNQDRQDYLDFMVSSAHKVLEEEGRTADAAKMEHLFNDIHPGSVLSLGEGELELNLAHERVFAAQKAIDDPNAPPVQVESAMIGTLMKNGIQLTPDFIEEFSCGGPHLQAENTRTHRTARKRQAERKVRRRRIKPQISPTACLSKGRNK